MEQLALDRKTLQIYLHIGESDKLNYWVRELLNESEKNMIEVMKK
jgi:hypothetical protein